MPLLGRDYSRETRDQLAELPVFGRCIRRELATVSRIGTRVPVPAGRRIVLAGSHGSEVMFVLSGYASCVVGSAEIAVFGPGDFFGEVAALTEGPRTATVAAVTDMDLLVLDRAELDSLLTEVPSVALHMLEALAKRLRRANDLAVAS